MRSNQKAYLTELRAAAGDLKEPQPLNFLSFPLNLRNERLYLLTEAAAGLMAARDADLMVLELFEKIRERLPVDAYFNYMVTEAGDALRLDSCAGVSPEVADVLTRLEFGEAVCGTVADLRQSMICEAVQESDDPKTELIRDIGIRAYACNPLMVGDRLLGTLSFASRTLDRFDIEDLEFFRAVCGFVAVAKERLRTESELERRVAERTRDLEFANKELEGFAYSISHDFRAPLRAIASTSAILLEDLGGQLSPEHQRSLVRQQENARRLARLVDDLLRYSRLARDKVVRARVNVTSMVKALTLEFCGGREARVEADMEAWADPALLRLVFENLIDNACKFSPNGDPIEVGTRIADGREAFYVRDYGVGFDMAYSPKLFKPFERLHRQEEFPGTGIGLANVRRIVERHGGTVGVESVLGEGSVFWFTLAD